MNALPRWRLATLFQISAVPISPAKERLVFQTLDPPSTNAMENMYPIGLTRETAV